MRQLFYYGEWTNCNLSGRCIFTFCVANCFSLPFGFQKEAGCGAAPHTRATARYSARERRHLARSAINAFKALKGYGGKQEFSPMSVGCQRQPRTISQRNDKLTYKLQFIPPFTQNFADTPGTKCTNIKIFSHNWYFSLDIT